MYYGISRRAALALALLGPQAARADATVALQLVLAVDTSGSVSQDRFALQQQGYAAAFRDPRVIRAIRTTATGSITVTMMQWTGPRMNAQVVPWTLLDTEPAITAFSASILAAPRRLFGGGTSVSGACEASQALLATSSHHGQRQVIDISGDGSNNRGGPPAEARDAAVAAGIVINGLPILMLEPSLDQYYRDHVIGGPGAFVIGARDYESFAEAIVKKLILEIAEGRGSPTASG